MDADEALMRAWDLGIDDAGWTDAVMAEAERLLPTLLQADYVTDDEAWTWWFSDAGKARAAQLEAASQADERTSAPGS